MRSLGSAAHGIAELAENVEGLDGRRGRHGPRRRRDDGRGLYTLVGLAAGTAGVWLPVSFLIGGFIATFSVYSYAKLGTVFPSRGGAAQFLVRCFGDGIVAGGLNVFQFIGWIIAMSLYAAGFAGYARDLLPWKTGPWVGKLIGAALVLLIVVVNLVGSKLVGRSEQFVIVVELIILALFVAAGHLVSGQRNDVRRCEPRLQGGQRR